MMTQSELLDERQKTHGDFAENASISQTLKDIFRRSISRRLPAVIPTPVQREALDMIALKLSRILSGQINFKDHWADIAGYATLAARELEK